MASFFSRFSIRTKLLASFALILSITVAVGLFTMYRMRNLHATTEVVTANYLPSITAVDELRSLTQQLRIKESNYLLTGDPADRKRLETIMNGFSTAYAQTRKNYDPLVDPGEEAERFVHIDKTWAQYLELHASMMSAAMGNDAQAATALFTGKANDVFSTLNDLYTQDVQYSANHATASTSEEEIYYRNSLAT